MSSYVLWNKRKMFAQDVRFDDTQAVFVEISPQFMIPIPHNA